MSQMTIIIIIDKDNDVVINDIIDNDNDVVINDIDFLSFFSLPPEPSALRL